ncbi:MAG: hypothetical protein NZM33_15360 [Bryobacteraceae bacterium]|nr:hypothetical protein [Bryobacteraceae bacterium]
MPAPAAVAAIALGAVLGAGRAATASETALVVDASEFFHEIPKGNAIADARMLRVEWLFNNTALCLRVPEEARARWEIPASGAYRVYVRSQGRGGSSFRLAIAGRTLAGVFGRGALSWEGGETVELASGPAELRLVEIAPGSCLDAIVLSRDPAFDPEALPRRRLPPDVTLLREYKIPPAGAVKFGDVTGDGRTDFLVLTREYSAHVFDHDGTELWNWKAPPEGARERASFEPPGVIWDLDRDGRAEVVHWRLEEGVEWLAVAESRSGTVKRKIPWPTRPLPHDYNNFRLAIGRLAPGYPSHILAFTDSGGEISVHAYDSQLQLLWNRTEKRKKDHLGHYVYPVDLTGDGVDEVVVSAMVLDARGRKLWDRFDLFSDHHDHADSFRFADLDEDGRPEILAPFSDVGVVVFRASDGEVLWKHPADHAQQLEVGRFLTDVPGLQIAVTARTYGNRAAGEPYLWGQVHWFDARGKLLAKWPRNPLTGNPDFVKGDWDGDGADELFWYKFRLDRQGRGVLYFEDPVYHMFDFTGSGRDEVITLAGGIMRVYGCAAPRGRRSARLDPDRFRWKVTNHTHY